MQISSPTGLCTIFNIYNDGNSQRTLDTLDDFLEINIGNIRPSDNDHMLWLGDFNWHHLLWEEPQNCHLFNYNAAGPLIDLIANYGMLQLLPCGIPTLQSTSTGNWTCPDNIFGTEQLADVIVSCNTDPGQCSPHTDHVPIHLILDLSTAKTNDTPSRNWRETDWEEFNKHLADTLTPFLPRPLASADEFQQAVKTLTSTITSTIEA